MEIPGIGTVTKSKLYRWYCSQPVPVPVLGGKPCTFIVEGYDSDQNKDDFHTAIANFLRIGRSVLNEAAPHLFQYYQDCKEGMEYDDDDDDEQVEISTPDDVWRFVHLGNEPMVTRRHHGDKGIYISLECGCDWEEEHGLQIVFKNGSQINKIGPYDGHLTNSDAYDDPSLENVIYQ